MMNRDEIQPRIRGALSRHWRTSLDRSGPTQGLVDDLAEITEQYAEDFAKRVTARKALREQAAVDMPAIAADLAAPMPSADDLNAITPPVGSATPASHRTRTRPRRGETA